MDEVTNVYEIFDKLQSLMELKTIKQGFLKMVQTGECSLGDYNRGFLAVSIYVSWNYKSDKHRCRVVYQTVDDGDFGGWSADMSEADATALVQKVASYYKGITTLPSDEQVNEDLRPLGMYIFHE